MKKLFTAYLLLHAASAFSQNFEWVREGSGIGQDIGQKVAVDLAGNVYVTGYFSGQATFSGTLYKGNGIFDMFLAKYDAAGNLLWFRSVGGIQDDAGIGVKTDSHGNVYVTGYFSEIAEFRDPANHIFHLASSGLTDIFLAKYDSSGNFIWASKAGGQFEDRGNNIALDAQNNIYLTGYFTDRGYFGSKTVISRGSTDAFIARYDTAGNCLWAQSLGGPGLDKSFGIAADSSGNSYITGFFYYTAWLSNSDSVLTGEGLSSDIFVAKYSPTGSNIFAKRIGGPYNDAAFAITVDREHSFYITGYFLDIATFGTYVLQGYGYDDIFVAKYDSTLDCRWAIHQGGEHLDLGLDIGLDNSGGVYVTGAFDSLAVFGNDSLWSVDSSYDVFVSKYNDKGILLWVKQAGGIAGDFGTGLCVQQTDWLYVTGYYKSFATFGNIAANFGHENDVFVTRISYPVGINSPTLPESTLRVYPNPSDGTFTVALPRAITGNAWLAITDIAGKNIFRESLASSSSRNIPIRFDFPAAGIYFVNVNDEKATQAARIAVMR